LVPVLRSVQFAGGATVTWAHAEATGWVVCGLLFMFEAVAQFVYVPAAWAVAVIVIVLL
jgi:hypothetical protein